MHEAAPRSRASIIEFGHPAGVDLFIFFSSFGAAIQRAINDWQLAYWSDTRAAAGKPRSCRTGEPSPPSRDRSLRQIGPMCRSMSVRAPTNRSAPPLLADLARAQELDLPLGIHVGGYGGHAPTGGGWPSYYIEEHQSNAHSVAAQLSSLVIEGVLERFPRLRIVFIGRRPGLDSRHHLADGPAFLNASATRSHTSSGVRRNM